MPTWTLPETWLFTLVAIYLKARHKICDVDMLAYLEAALEDDSPR